MQLNLRKCRISKYQNMQNMLYMQKMQNNMFKINYGYANKYAEYVNR